MGPNFKLIKKLKADLASQFKITDLSPITYYLRIKVTYIDISITVTQTVYINQFLASH